MKAAGRKQQAEGGREGSKDSPFRAALRPGPSTAAFTLIELVLVMAVLVTMLAIVAPVISRSMRGRNLEQQGARLQALTEYCRDEAANLGVPMTVWVDPESRRFGADVKAGYTADAAHRKEYALPADLNFDPVQGAQAAKTSGHGFDVAEFAPDGTLDPVSAPSVRIANRTNGTAISVTQTPDGYGYQIVKEAGR